MLEISELTVRYGPVLAVDSVDLTVEKGEIVALLGANGAGKSTLLKAVVGLLPLAGGAIRFDGEIVSGRSPEWTVRRGMALCPEGRRVFAELSVEENLRLGAAVERDSKAIAARREEMFGMFPILRERAKQPAGSLSGGQQQMLAIGRALMSAPKLLLLDEPSLGLAPVVVEQVFGLVEGLPERGTTVLIVEQNAHRALEIADRAYVLANGRVQTSGRASDVGASEDVQLAYLGVV